MALDQHEQRQQHDAGDQAADHDRVVPAADPALGDAEREPGEAGHERRGAEEVEPAVGVAPGELVQHAVAPGGAEQRERHVEPEHPVPRDRDERAAEHRPEHEPDRGDHRVRPHRQAELLARERVGDERGGVGEQERGADALEDPPQDQLGAVLGEAGAQRGEREDDEAADVGLLAAEQVGQPARGEHEHGRGDHVGEDHPHEAEQRRVQRALEVGQGDDQRARVDGREQHPQAGAGERPPLVVGVPGVDPESVFHVNVKFSGSPTLVGMRLSVLDQSPISEGSTGADALRTRSTSRATASRSATTATGWPSTTAARSLAGPSPGGADPRGGGRDLDDADRQRRRDAPALLAVQGRGDVHRCSPACSRTASTSASAARPAPTR